MKIPPFRVFTQPSGLPTGIHMMYDPKGNESNLFVDIPTLTYWYWMMCGLTIDLGYTVNGGIEVPVRHRTYLDARKFLPKHRAAGAWDIARQITDDDLDITTNCWLLLRYPRCDTIPQDLYRAHRKYLEERPKHTLLWRHSEMPANTRFGLCFLYLEYADNRDFTIYTLPGDIPKRRPIISTIQANFLGQTIPFYLTTPYPDDIAAHFDFVRITPEFFEIDSSVRP